MTLSLFATILNVLTVCLVPALIITQFRNRRYLRENRRLLQKLQEQNRELIEQQREALALRAQRFSVPESAKDASTTRH